MFLFWPPPQQPWHRPGYPFRLPQIHATVQVPSPFYILPPYHPTLTQSPSFPHLALAATHLFPRNNLYRERKNTFSGTFMQRHTFFKGIPCIADENHLCRRQSHSQTRHSEPRHTIFREITCVAKGERCFRKTAKPMSTVTLNRSSRTRFGVRIGRYRTADEREEWLCRASAYHSRAHRLVWTRHMSNSLASRLTRHLVSHLSCHIASRLKVV